MCPSLIRTSLRSLDCKIVRLFNPEKSRNLSFCQSVLRAAQQDFTLYSSSVQYTIFCTVLFSVNVTVGFRVSSLM